VFVEYCCDVGRDFDVIICSVNYNVVIGCDEVEVEDWFVWIEVCYV